MWRDSAIVPTFFFLDYRAVFPLLLVILHIAIWTMVISLISILGIAFIQRFGFTPPVALRFIRMRLAGRVRYGLDFDISVTTSTWQRRWESTR